jgi:uncharacterized repeat protein (TIGR03803 family)
MDRRFPYPIGVILAIVVFVSVAMPMGAVGASGSTKVVYGFKGDEKGEYPATELVFDTAGNLFGTTVLGGEVGAGTVFELTRSDRGWGHAVLYSFAGGVDGGQPYGGVTVDPQGNLFGTAVIGGTGGACPEDGCGVVYQLTQSNGVWAETVIHDFAGDDGYGPGAGLTLDPRGNLYGMTPTGGAYGLGVIYQLHPDGSGGWRFRVIHDFTGGTDGATGSAGRLLLDGAGNLYGVATVGGANGKGTAFKLSRDHAGGWNLKTIYAFKGQPDAGFPYGALTFGANGNLYGTTYYDGANNFGSVYELKRANGGWKERVLYSFAGGSDGSNSISNLLFDGTGNLYGTTSEGGDPVCDCGTIFELTPAQDGTWTETVVHRFAGAPGDGGYAYNGMVSDPNGRFYGATVHGGGADEGSVYRFTP